MLLLTLVAFSSHDSHSFIEHDRVSGFWTWLFVLSKLPELGDTVFIVLRKQPLIFLHWYHHITVLMYSWFSYTEYTASARWFIVMNYCVHSVMYSYYALRALNFKPPRSIAMLITTLQLTQMVVGCAINIWAHGFLQTAGKNSCNISEMNIKLSIAMYFSYFVLFARFFYKTYLSTNARKGKRPIQVTASSTATSGQYIDSRLISGKADVQSLLAGQASSKIKAQ
uniref:Elongation of very long chain fatty acids protein n=1 Tax=Anopheles dirus TaxID=7168 RepID=A0A182NIX0_9DIPT